MSSQIKPSVTNPTIAGIYREISDGLLILAPEFQRKFVWTQEHQEQFIETILKGLPFPEIYVSTGEVDIENMRTVKNVIDGQQRLTTIKRFIEGQSDRPLKIVSPYAALSEQEKSDFLSYQIVVRDLGKVDSDMVREIFRRINLTKFKLDAVEVHNAIYDGAFIQVAKSVISETNLAIFGVFRESEFTRMADLHLVLTVMSTLELGGYFSQDSEVGGFIERYNEEYAQADAMLALLREAFFRIDKLELPKDSMWFRKANFFTLVVEIARNINRLRDDLRNQLLALEDLVMENKRNSETDFGIYYSYMYQNTNGRKARIVRSELFKRFCVLQ